MKKYILILLLASFIGVFCNCMKSVPANPFTQIFTQDSGYIFRDDALKLMLYAKLTDTIDCTWLDSCYNPWNNHHASDTLGKYYRHEGSSAYMASILSYDKDEAVYRILKVDKDKQIILSDSSNAISTKYSYYSDAQHFLLGKIGKSYYVRYNGHGTSYWDETFCFFTDINQPKNQVVAAVWDSPTINYRSLNSIMELIDNVIRFHYEYEEGADVSEIDTIIDYQPYLTEKFDIDYIWENGRLVARDSTIIKLEKYPV